MEAQIEQIRRLVGNVTEHQIRHIDSYVCEQLGVFLPMSGPCDYALSPKHSHPSYMFVCGFNGDVEVDVSGRIVTSPAGTVQCMSPGIEHQELPSNEIPRYNAIFIGASFFEKQAQYYNADIPVLVARSIVRPNLLLNKINHFIAEASLENMGREAVLYAIAVEISHLLLRAIFSYETDYAVSHRHDIDKAIEYIDRNIAEKLTVGAVSEYACMSVTHLSRVFKKETGMTVNEFVLEKRLAKAKRLLIANTHSLTDIADECGFNSLSYFSSVFQKKYKIAPSLYAKAMANGRISKKQD